MSLSPSSSRGGGGGLALTGGTLTGPLVLAPTDPTATCLTLTLPAGASAHDNAWLKGTQADTPASDLLIDGFGDLQMVTNDTDRGVIQLYSSDTFEVQNLDPHYGPRLKAIQRSGALPTLTFTSGTAAQVDIHGDRELVIPFTGDGTNNVASLLIQLSPDNVTYSTLDTLSIAAALNLTGALNVPASILVPATWYVKLTAVHGTIGTATYY